MRTVAAAVRISDAPKVRPNVRTDGYSVRMPRLPRHNQPATVYHLISRFLEHRWFLAGDEERLQYLRLLGLALKDSDWRCISYALMSSHVHLGMIAGEQPLADWLRLAHGPFGEWVNARNDRIGNVFVRGPNQFTVYEPFIPKLLAYIHNNPVRARVVARAADSTWTSHAAYLGLVVPPPWLDVETGLARSGLATASDLDDHVNARLEVRDKLGIAPPKRSTSTSTDEEGDTPLAPIIEAAAAVLGVTPALLRSKRRTNEAVLGRHLVVRCARDLGATLSQIAGALAISEQFACGLGHRDERPEQLGALQGRAFAYLRDIS